VWGVSAPIEESFAFLLPLTALESKSRQALYHAHGIDLLVLDKRMDFERPGEKKSHAWFPVAWFCWRLGLPKQLTFTTSFHSETNMKGKNMKTKDLAQLGIIEDPDHPGQGMLLKDMAKPNEQMDNETLAALAKKYEAKADHLSKQESLQRFLQGWALTIVHDRMGRGPHKGWTSFLTRHSLSRPTAYRAEELYLRSRKEWSENAEEEVAQRTLTELYLMLGIVHEKSEDKSKKTPKTKHDSANRKARNGPPATKRKNEEEHENGREENPQEERGDQTKTFSAASRATVALNILEDLYHEMSGSCDNDLLKTFDLINDVIEAIKKKGYEDDEELQRYQPESISEVSMAG
jgi:hypothetical protein